MWDLNRTERRALAASLLLVGLSGIGRAVLPPAPAEFVVEGAPAGAADDIDGVHAAVRGALGREARALTPIAVGERIDIATAPTEELRRLPGIGPGLAEAIVRERDRGPFSSPADLERVPGIGPATRSRLEPYVSFGPTRAATAPAGSDRTGTSERAAARTGASQKTGCAGGRVELNRARSDELERLPGIGPAMAGRILASREMDGAFSTVAALERVPGIGPARMARLRPLVCVDPG